MLVFANKQDIKGALTSAEIWTVSSPIIDHPDLVKLDRCDLTDGIIIGEDKVCHAEFPVFWLGPTFVELIKFSGVAAGEACTVVLRGSTHQMVDGRNDPYTTPYQYCLRRSRRPT